MPPTEPSWLRIVAPPHPSRQAIEAFEQACQWTATRRGGPGGQHRNKTSTAVVLHHRPTEVTAEANERRSQAENRQRAVQRLRSTLAVVVRCQPDQDPADARLRQQHRGRQVWVAERNAARPAVLSLVLDDAWAAEGDLQAVASRWETTASQLLKLLRSEPPALDYLNQMRGWFELRPLR
ncbi:peptide chain release factor family protein [Roseimaritima sediminicola]|uniref:peptide chain release factor family protein n=1 Tax=Roseimaritima sediminicola TaxID=2662066 RepID=UPI00129852DF|nr:peptide chain release factor-like protein [Roseimaritima sediminicola]